MFGKTSLKTQIPSIHLRRAGLADGHKVISQMLSQLARMMPVTNARNAEQVQDWVEETLPAYSQRDRDAALVEAMMVLSHLQANGVDVQKLGHY